MSDGLIERIEDLYKQATTEKTHFYTASVLHDTMIEIATLKAETVELYKEVEELRIYRETYDEHVKKLVTLKAENEELKAEKDELLKPDKVMIDSLAGAELEILSLKAENGRLKELVNVRTENGVRDAARVKELEGNIRTQSKVMTKWGMGKDDRDRYLTALKYMADENNWQICDGYVRMKRPGGGGKQGIVLVSHTLLPWTFAAGAIGEE